MSVSWQKVFSTLASERFRELYARAVLGEDLDPTARERAKLVAAGLLREDGSVDGELFKNVLAAASGPRPQGVDRFFTEGRLDGLPSSPAERLAVLEHIADRLFPDSQELDEPMVNRLIGTVARDIPTLRRALVDYAFLDRNADGTGYRRARAE